MKKNKLIMLLICILMIIALLSCENGNGDPNLTDGITLSLTGEDVPGDLFPVSDFTNNYKYFSYYVFRNLLGEDYVFPKKDTIVNDDGFLYINNERGTCFTLFSKENYPDATYTCEPEKTYKMTWHVDASDLGDRIIFPQVILVCDECEKTKGYFQGYKQATSQTKSISFLVTFDEDNYYTIETILDNGAENISVQYDQVIDCHRCGSKTLKDFIFICFDMGIYEDFSKNTDECVLIKSIDFEVIEPEL